MTRDYLYHARRAPSLPPLSCHECSEVCTERGIIYERRAGWASVGWEGVVNVRMPDGARERQRIGACPDHREAEGDAD